MKTTDQLNAKKQTAEINKKMDEIKMEAKRISSNNDFVSDRVLQGILHDLEETLKFAKSC